MDVFNETGRLVEYALVDREARRVEFYGPDARLTAHGRLDPSSGLVERAGVHGRPRETILLPLPPAHGGIHGRGDP